MLYGINFRILRDLLEIRVSVYVVTLIPFGPPMKGGGVVLFLGSIIQIFSISLLKRVISLICRFVVDCLLGIVAMGIL
jgi:hypothetical protein